LLLKYPGITSAVVFRNPGENSVHVRFRCVDALSLKAIAYCAVGANVTIKLGDPDTGLCAERDASTDLPCDITIPDEETELPIQLQRFGAYLAAVLTGKGLVSAEESQRLQSGWNTRLTTRQLDH
jgi:hypothetical protein